MQFFHRWLILPHPQPFDTPKLRNLSILRTYTILNPSHNSFREREFVWLAKQNECRCKLVEIEVKERRSEFT